MWARLSAFVIWAAVAAGAVHWGLQLWVRPAPVPAHAVLAVHEPAAGGDWTKALGAAPVPVVAASAATAPVAADARFKLLGVIAPANRSIGEGLALISIDGLPARAVAAGQRLDGDLRVLRVGHRQVELGQPGQAAQLVLELPALAPPAQGVPGAVALPVPALRAPADGLSGIRRTPLAVPQPMPVPPAAAMVVPSAGPRPPAASSPPGS
ncbi:MAG: hypothetical protein ACKVQR_23380 [Aquabacterium sp.]